MHGRFPSSAGHIHALRIAAGLALAGLLAAGAGHAQYPSRPVRLEVSIAPGGAPDVIARTVADMLGPPLGQTIVVENRAGANGNIAMGFVAKSEPDGYTRLSGHDSMLAIAGEVSAAITSSVTGTHVRAGRLRGLAVTGSRRLPAFPDLPAIAEFYPVYEMSSWFGMFGPAALPESVIVKLGAAISRVLGMPEVRQRLQAAGQFEPHVTTREEFADRIRADYEKFGTLVKQIGIKVD